MSKAPLSPHLVVADPHGEIYDHPDLLMLCRRGNQWGLPRPDELIPLPPESELFLLPKRKACGLNPTTGEIEIVEDCLAVAAFLAPAHTISAHPVYAQDPDAPLLPLFAYGAVGFANEMFYVCAKLVDQDQRQIFRQISRDKIAKKSRQLLKAYPKNRLVAHILNNCVARYDCPAARNFALGRFEAPLPTSQACNAHCICCISSQDKGSAIKTTPQCRINFTPTAAEICEVMQIHASHEQKTPIFSFGQGCEGDPLINADLLARAIQKYRDQGGHGTINCNTNASKPEAIPLLAKAGLTSMRVSMNSAQEKLYTRYYRCQSYTFKDVQESIRLAREENIFVSINLLFFPGLTDTEEELEALANLVGSNGVSMIQWRNLNVDPVWYYQLMTDFSLDVQQTNFPSSNAINLQDQTKSATSGMGLGTFMHLLRKLCPWLIYGYFNPYLDDHPTLKSPTLGTWQMPDWQKILASEDEKSTKSEDIADTTYTRETDLI